MAMMKPILTLILSLLTLSATVSCDPAVRRQIEINRSELSWSKSGSTEENYEYIMSVILQAATAEGFILVGSSDLKELSQRGRQMVFKSSNPGLSITENVVCEISFQPSPHPYRIVFWQWQRFTVDPTLTKVIEKVKIKLNASDH